MKKKKTKLNMMTTFLLYPFSELCFLKVNI